MREAKIRPLVVIALGIFLTSALAGQSATNGLQPFDTCDLISNQATEWVDWFLKENSSLPSYEATLKLPRSIQKEIVHRFSSTEKAVFWKKHVLSSLQFEATSEQATAVLRVSDLISSDLFERAEKLGFQSVAEDVMSIRRMLSQAVGESGSAAMGQLPSWSSSTAAALSTDEVPDCGCNTQYWEECGGFTSVICIEPDENHQCDWRSWGCGFWFLEECDGICCLVIGGQLRC